MTYFDLFNKVMLELNYRPVSVFENIFKSEHLKILDNLNLVNSEVLQAFDWNFLIRKKHVCLENGEISVENAVDGRPVKVMEGSRQLKYSPYYEKFYAQNPPCASYSVFGDDLLFKKSQKKRNFTVYYCTNKIVKGKAGEEKEQFTDKDDTSIMPMPYAEQILVYGTCLRTKANPNFPKFAFWNLMFKEALLKLRATCSKTFEECPFISLSPVKKGR